MPAVKNVGELCAGEPHARFDVAAGGNQTSRASTRRAAQAPLADPTVSVRVWAEDDLLKGLVAAVAARRGPASGGHLHGAG